MADTRIVIRVDDQGKLVFEQFKDSATKSMEQVADKSEQLARRTGGAANKAKASINNLATTGSKSLDGFASNIGKSTAKASLAFRAISKIGGKDMAVGFSNAFGKVSTSFSSFISKAKTQFGNFATEFSVRAQQMASRVGAVAAAVGAIGIGFLGKSIIGAVGEMEDFTAQFEVLYGSTEKATAALKELVTFTATTPFQLPEVIKTGKQLKVMTEGALDNAKGLALVGNAASAAGVRINDLAMWFGRLYSVLSAGGSQIGEPMMRLQELGIVSTKVRTQIESMIEAGVDGAKVWSFFENYTSRFAGLMERQSKTYRGIVSNIEDTLDEVKRRIGNQFFGSVKKVAQDTLDFLNKQLATGAFERFGQKVGRGVNIAIAAFKSLFSFIQNNKETIKELSAIGVTVAAVGSAVLLLMNPVGKVLALSIALPFIWKKFRGSIDDSEVSVQSLFKNIATGAVFAVSAIGDMIDKFKELFRLSKKDQLEDLTSGLDRKMAGLPKVVNPNEINKLLGFGKGKRLIDSYLQSLEAIETIKDKIAKIEPLSAEKESEVLAKELAGLLAVQAKVKAIKVGSPEKENDFLQSQQQLLNKIEETQNKIKGNKTAVESVDSTEVSWFAKKWTEAKATVDKFGIKLKDVADASPDLLNQIKKEIEKLNKEAEMNIPTIEAIKFFGKYKDAGLDAVEKVKAEFSRERKFYLANYDELKSLGLDYAKFYKSWNEKITDAQKVETEKRLKDDFSYWIQVKENAKLGGETAVEDMRNSWTEITRLINSGAVGIGMAMQQGFDYALSSAETFETAIFQMGERIRDGLQKSFAESFNYILNEVDSTTNKITNLAQSVVATLQDTITGTMLEGFTNEIAKTLTEKIGITISLEDKQKQALVSGGKVIKADIESSFVNGAAVVSNSIDSVFKQAALDLQMGLAETNANKISRLAPTVVEQKVVSANGVDTQIHDAIVGGSVVAAGNIKAAIEGSTVNVNKETSSTSASSGFKDAAIMGGIQLLSASQRPGGVQGQDIGSALGMIGGTALLGPGIGTMVGGLVGGLFGGLFDKQDDTQDRQLKALQEISRNTNVSAQQLTIMNRNVEGLRRSMEDIYPMPESAYFSEGNLSEQISTGRRMISQ